MHLRELIRNKVISDVITSISVNVLFGCPYRRKIILDGSEGKAGLVIVLVNWGRGRRAKKINAQRWSSMAFLW